MALIRSGLPKRIMFCFFITKIWLFDTQSYHFTTLFQSFSYRKPGGRTGFHPLLSKNILPQRSDPQKSSRKIVTPIWDPPRGTSGACQIGGKGESWGGDDNKGHLRLKFLVPKSPERFKKGGVFLSRWKEYCDFWRCAESRNELIHMLRSFLYDYAS